MNSSCAISSICTIVPSAGDTTTPASRRAVRIAKEPDNAPTQKQRHGRQPAQILAKIPRAPREQRRQQKKGPGNQPQFRQPDAGERQPVAPGERIVGRGPMVSLLIAIELDVPRIERVKRTGVVFPLAQRGHPRDVPFAKRFQVPAPHVPPGQFQRHAHAASRLDRADLRIHRLQRQAARRNTRRQGRSVIFLAHRRTISGGFGIGRSHNVIVMAHRSFDELEFGCYAERHIATMISEFTA
jgi:hypothetical protein